MATQTFLFQALIMFVPPHSPFPVIFLSFSLLPYVNFPHVNPLRDARSYAKALPWMFFICVRSADQTFHTATVKLSAELDTVRDHELGQSITDSNAMCRASKSSTHGWSVNKTIIVNTLTTHYKILTDLLKLRAQDPCLHPGWRKGNYQFSVHNFSRGVTRVTKITQ